MVVRENVDACLIRKRLCLAATSRVIFYTVSCCSTKDDRENDSERRHQFEDIGIRF